MIVAGLDDQAMVGLGSATPSVMAVGPRPQKIRLDPIMLRDR